MTQTAKTRQRRSGRIPRQLPIQVSGIDAMGRDFTTSAHTSLLSRHGAEIILKNELVPDQEVSICLLGNAQDWDARIVGLFAKRPDGFAYGVEFLFEDANFWGISFPPAAGSAVGAPAPKEKAARANGGATSPRPLDDDIDFDKLLKGSRSAAAPKNYVLRLKCPHMEAHGGGGAPSEDDQWLILQHREESLKQILEAAWDFSCPIHGAQREFPLEAKQIEDGFEIRLGSSKAQASAGRSAVGNPKTGPKARREARLPEVLRVMVRGVDSNGNVFRQSAHSVDISLSGARLEGLGMITLPGTTIEVRRNWRKALFRIVWAGKRGTAQASQVGIVCLEPGKNVWNIPAKN